MKLGFAWLGGAQAHLDQANCELTDLDGAQDLAGQSLTSPIRVLVGH